MSSMSEYGEDKSPFELTEEEMSQITIPSLTYGGSLSDNLPTLKPVYVDAELSNEWLHDLGSLAVLPVEIQQLIVNGLDIETLANFRRVNRKADFLFRSIPGYRWVAREFPQILLAIWRIRTGRWTTYNDLFTELHRPDCENCGDFAPWLYLLTCRRVCYLCFTTKDRYWPLRIYRAHQKFAVTQSVLLGLPHMYSAAGEYSEGQHDFRTRRLLVDRNGAYQASLKIHGSKEEMDNAVRRLRSEEQQEWAELKAKGAVEGDWRLRGIMNDTGTGNPHRFMAIMSVPWVNREEEGQTRLEWGAHCSGCRNYSLNPGMHYGRKYSIKGFREHLVQYGSIYRIDDGPYSMRHRGQLPPAGWAL